jgi:hypothetical protein
MNCDQAFDFLTDSKLHDASELHAHLASCPRCCDLADALEPALGLFDQADSFEDPNTWANDSVSSFDNSQTYDVEAARPVREQRVISAPWMNAQRQQQRRSARRDGSKVAIVLLFIAAITAAFTNVGREERNEQRKAAVLAEVDFCIRESHSKEFTAKQTVTKCLTCHIDLVDFAKLEDRQEANAGRTVTQCVTCHLRPQHQRTLDANPGLLRACLFPVTKS